MLHKFVQLGFAYSCWSRSRPSTLLPRRRNKVLLYKFLLIYYVQQQSNACSLHANCQWVMTCNYTPTTTAAARVMTQSEWRPESRADKISWQQCSGVMGNVVSLCEITWSCFHQCLTAGLPGCSSELQLSEASFFKKETREEKYLDICDFFIFLCFFNWLTAVSTIHSVL